MARRDPIVEDVMLEFHLNTRDATRGVVDLQRKMETLTSIVERSETLGEGFITPRQLFTARKIMDEMRNNFSSYHEARMRMEERYRQKAMSSMKSVQRYSDKAEEIRTAGGSSRIEDFYRVKARKEAAGFRQTFGLSDNQYERLQDRMQNGGMSMNRVADTLARNHPQVARMNNVVGMMREEMVGLPSTEGRMGNLHERDRGFKYLRNNIMQAAVSTGAMLSVGMLAHYVHGGMSGVKRSEYDAALLGQRLGDGFNYTGDDATLRRRAGYTGLINNYDTFETLKTQNILASGGLNSGNMDSLLADTAATQRFARGYAVDADELAGGGAMLRRMGALGEGEMQRFANLIGGAVSKSGMHGREGEMLRATISLAKSVGDKLPDMNKQQLSNIIGLQAELGKSVPGLRGERGAQTLAGIDNAFKHSSNELDILQGKGWRPGYTGIKGSLQLRMKQELGISDPTNLQEALTGMDYILPGDSDPETKKMMTYSVLKDHFGVDSMQTAKKMMDSGFLDRVKKGELRGSSYADELESYGLADAANRARKWDSTHSDQRAYNAARSMVNQFNIAEPIENVTRNVNTAWNSYVPLPLQVGLGVWGGTRGIPWLYKNSGKAANWARQTFGRNVAGQGGFATGMSRLWTNGSYYMRNAHPSMARYLMDPIGRAGSALWNGIGRIGDSSKYASWAIGDYGRGLAANGGRMAGYAGRALEFGGKMLGRSIPLIGGGIEYLTDRYFNSRTDEARSKYKAIGSMIGSGLGLLGAGAVGAGTGGVGLLAGAAITGGASAAGSYAGDKLFTYLHGDRDLKEQEVYDQQQDAKSIDSNAPINPQSVNTSNISANSLIIGDKDLSQIMQRDDKREDGYRNYAQSDHGDQAKVIKVEISGEIKGGTKEKQNDLISSISDFFKRKSGVDLENDTVRT